MRCVSALFYRILVYYNNSCLAVIWTSPGELVNEK